MNIDIIGLSFESALKTGFATPFFVKQQMWKFFSGGTEQTKAVLQLDSGGPIAKAELLAPNLSGGVLRATSV